MRDQVPRIFCGPHSKVKREIRKVLSSSSSGEEFCEHLGKELIEIEDVGSFALRSDRHLTVSGPTPRFWCDMATELIYEKTDRENLSMEQGAMWMTPFLNMSWGGLAMLSATFLRDLESCRRLLAWFVENRQLVESIGCRFYSGSGEPKFLWQWPTSFHVALSRLGVAQQDMRLGDLEHSIGLARKAIEGYGG